MFAFYLLYDFKMYYFCLFPNKYGTVTVRILGLLQSYESNYFGVISRAVGAILVLVVLHVNLPLNIGINKSVW